jgi:lipoteichoic acid synthase
MTDAVIALILLIITSSIKSLFIYVDMGLVFHLLLAHVLTTFGFSTLFVLLTLKSKRRIWFITWYVTYAFLLFLNTNYFEFYGKFLHLTSAYILIPEAIILTKNLAVPFDVWDLIFVVDLPIFFCLLRMHIKKEIRFPHFKATLGVAAAATLCGSGLLFFLPVNYNSKMLSQAENSAIIARYGFTGYFIKDILKPSDNDSIKTIRYGQLISGTGTSGRHPNMVLIQIESLDANIINYRYRGQYVTPFLHDLTAKSLYFPYTLCYRKLGGTSDCEIAVNNGIEPPVDSPLIMDEGYHYPNSMVKVLKKAGYSAEAFHGNGGWYYKRLSAYAAMGYENFFDPKVMKLEEKGWGVPDSEVLNYVAKHLQNKKSPFFASIITMSSHEPFNNTRHFGSDHRFDAVEPQVTGRYFASIAYADHAIGEFVAKIRVMHPDTYFFLYGDHTPYVINEGPFRRSVLREGEEKEMVPLFIIAPNGQTRQEHDAVASYLDLAPTILHAAGVNYSYKSLGMDLLAGTPLVQPVVFRGQQYSRRELFDQMTAALAPSRGGS